MRRFLSTVLLLTVLLCPVFAADSGMEAEVDHLAIVTVMIYDGRLEKAEAALAQVDTSAETFDAARYYTIRGVLDAKKERYESSLENYRKAILATRAKTFTPPGDNRELKYLFSIGKEDAEKAPETDFDAEKVKKEKLEKLYLYLSQAHYKVGDYANTLKSLELAGDRGKDRAALFALRAECYWKLEQYSEAIQALNSGLKRFPESPDLLQQKYYYFANQGFYRAAIDCARKYMAVIEADEKEYVMLAQLLFEANQLNQAIEILEGAKIKFPESANVDMLLGHIYMKKDMDHTAAHLFKEGSYKDKKYLKDAVEMHRRIGDYAHAIFLNAQMSDTIEKLKQKVAIFLDRGEYEKVIGVKDDLERYSILKDDNMRYALAYSYYMAKDYPNAEYHIKQIQVNTLFEKGTVILQNIERCRENIMECF